MNYIETDEEAGALWREFQEETHPDRPDEVRWYAAMNRFRDWLRVKGLSIRPAMFDRIRRERIEA